MNRPRGVVYAKTQRARAYADIAKDYPPSSDAERRSPWSTIRSCAAVNLMTGVALRPENGAMYGDNAAGEVGLGKKVIARLEPSSVIVADRGVTLGTSSCESDTSTT